MLVRSIRQSVMRIDGRAYRCTFVALQNNKNNNPYSADDKADEERERKLREQFAQKIMNSKVGNEKIRNVGNAKSPWEMFKLMREAAEEQHRQQGGQPNGMPFQTAARRISVRDALMRFIMYMMAIYIIVFVYQLSDENSQLSLMQGIPWWAQPIDSTVYFLLVRTVLGFSEQRRFKEDYSAAQRMNPTLTMGQFVQQTNPNLFAGHRTHPQEIVAALCACFAASNDLKVATTMQIAVRGTSDKAECVDKIMDALRRDYPQVFSPQQQQAYMPPPQAAPGFAPPPPQPVQPTMAQPVAQPPVPQTQVQSIPPQPQAVVEEEPSAPAMVDPLATPSENRSA